MVLALLAGLAVLMLVACVTCAAMCVAAARADSLMRRQSGARAAQRDPARPGAASSPLVMR